MSHFAYFGYGSLINRATHQNDVVEVRAARLNGWRRCWRPRPDMPGFPAVLLSVRREEGASCEGVVVTDHVGNLAALDAREARYSRHELGHGELHLHEGEHPAMPVYVYQANEAIPPHRDPPHILQSYLDAVMKGLLELHGEASVAAFIATTDGFDYPIHRDRTDPVYPRAIGIDAAEMALFDALLEEAGCRFA